MSTQSPEAADTTEKREPGETDRLSRPKRVLSTVRRRGGNGTSAALAGGTLLVAAARTAARNRRRAGVIAAAGVAMLGAGIKRRRSAADASRPGERPERDSAEAAAHRTGSDLVDGSETDPRGVSGDSDVATAPGEGAIQFTTGQDETGEPKPHLDSDDPVDPRYADREDPLPDDHVEVSLSETKTTDELGKVAAPDEEQAYPASEGTDPEPMSEKAPPRHGEGAVANKGTGGSDTDRENGDRAAPDDVDRTATDDSEAGE